MVTGFTANVLLAVGASPAMVIAAEEVEDFAAVAEGLLVNVGTVTSADTDAMNRAARAARAARTPWVLDPVAVGPLRFRTELVGRLLEHGPSIIRNVLRSWPLSAAREEEGARTRRRTPEKRSRGHASSQPERERWWR